MQYSHSDCKHLALMFYINLLTLSKGSLKCCIYRQWLGGRVPWRLCPIQISKQAAVRVVRKQPRVAISPATQLTCAVYFLVRSKKYLSVESKQGKKGSNIDNYDHQMKAYFHKVFWGRTPRPPFIGWLTPSQNLIIWQEPHDKTVCRLLQLKRRLLRNLRTTLQAASVLKASKWNTSYWVADIMFAIFYSAKMEWITSFMFLTYPYPQLVQQ